MSEKSIALATIGGLSNPSKMPCYSFSLPAYACKTGAKLAVTPGTVCSACYATRGNYLFPSVLHAQAKRLELLRYWQKTDPEVWVNAFVTLLKHEQFFRWHDSGDVQDSTHLEMIEEVARRLPSTKFWLPTHEVWVAKRTELMPHNVIVRLSATKVDGKPSRTPHVHTSQVLTRQQWENNPVDSPLNVTCSAPMQGNKCGSCRACWDKNVRNVAYLKH